MNVCVRLCVCVCPCVCVCLCVFFVLVLVLVLACVCGGMFHGCLRRKKPTRRPGPAGRVILGARLEKWTCRSMRSWTLYLLGLELWKPNNFWTWPVGGDVPESMIPSGHEIKPNVQLNRVKLNSMFNLNSWEVEKFGSFQSNINSSFKSCTRFCWEAPSPKTPRPEKKEEEKKSLQEWDRTPIFQDLVLVGGGHSHVHVLRMLGMEPVPGASASVSHRGGGASIRLPSIGRLTS